MILSPQRFTPSGFAQLLAPINGVELVRSKEQVAVITINMRSAFVAATSALVFTLVFAARAQPPAVPQTDDYGYDSKLLHAAAARGPRHLVFLDRRQREVLGRDGPDHRGQRQPAELPRLAPSRPALPRARRDHAAGLRGGDGSRSVRALAGSLRPAAGARRARRGQRHRRPAEVSEPEVRRLASGTRRSICSIPGTCSRRTSSA